MVRVDINSKFLEKGEKLRLTIKPEGFPPLAIRLLKPGKKPLEMDFTRSKGKVSATYENVDRDGLYVFNIRKGQRTFKKWAVVGDLLLD